MAIQHFSNLFFLFLLFVSIQNFVLDLVIVFERYAKKANFAYLLGDVIMAEKKIHQMDYRDNRVKPTRQFWTDVTDTPFLSMRGIFSLVVK